MAVIPIFWEAKAGRLQIRAQFGQLTRALSQNRNLGFKQCEGPEFNGAGESGFPTQENNTMQLSTRKGAWGLRDHKGA